MAVVKKSFTTGYPVENNVLPVRCHPLTGDNVLTEDVFYDVSCVESDDIKGAVLFFAGGSGRGQNDEVDTPRTLTAVKSNFIYINCKAMPNSPTNIGRQNQYPVHDFYSTDMECQAQLNLLRDTIIPELAKVVSVDQSLRVVLCGTSRGAGVIGSWSEMTRKNYANNKDRVVAILANAPAGSLDNGKYRDGYYQIRSTYHMFQCANHPILGTVGANDITNLTRPVVERAITRVTNKLFSFQVIGDEKYPHTWTYLYPQEFIDMAISLFNRYKSGWTP